MGGGGGWLGLLQGFLEMHIEETKTGQARINEKFKYLNAICHETLVVNGGGWGEIKGHQECS